MAMPFLWLLWLGSSIRRHDHHHLNATAFLIETKALESLVFSWSSDQLRLPSGRCRWLVIYAVSIYIYEPYIYMRLYTISSLFSFSPSEDHLWVDLEPTKLGDPVVTCRDLSSTVSFHMVILKLVLTLWWILKPFRGRNLGMEINLVDLIAQSEIADAPCIAHIHLYIYIYVYIYMYIYIYIPEKGADESQPPKQCSWFFLSLRWSISK